ncbi:MAG: hypothetical protein LBU89_00200 [Fibromonadaceae bacterium]|jgi:uncharacterized protein (TIGR02145 family)|nr:hypothetical protein [Fibromonadaceae bacterium]
MKKILFSVYAVFAFFGCSGLIAGDSGDLPCLGCDGYAYSSSSSRPSSSSVVPSSSSVSVSFGTVTYNGQTYKTVTIGSQTWMAENLNYNASDSRCYGDDSGGDSQNMCGTYGRLYDWATAMGLPSSCNGSDCSSQITAKHRGICPQGWHVPTNAEWSALEENAVGARHLKAQGGWFNCGPAGSGKSYRCDDTFGFAALSGGFGYGGDFGLAGNYGYWWSATQIDASGADYRHMSYTGENVGWDYNGKDYLFSVRCLQN